MEKGSGTRSGLLWEVERLLDECDELPQILLMENVPDVVGNVHIKNFQKWRLKLEQLGYSNYVKVLNAKNYGIPQNRARCYMVSILGEYNYNFPKPFKLKSMLKDVLEKKVDEKYYLSASKLKYIKETSFACNSYDTNGLDENFEKCVTSFMPSFLESVDNDLVIGQTDRGGGRWPSLKRLKKDTHLQVKGMEFT